MVAKSKWAGGDPVREMPGVEAAEAVCGTGVGIELGSPETTVAIGTLQPLDGKPCKKGTN
jgi:hypothetical protein